MAEGRSRSATIADFVDRAFAVLGEVDYFRILGVTRQADPDAVRAAYYKLAASLHPDVHGDECEAGYRQRLTSVYSRVVEAYRVLSDPAKRQLYEEGLADGELRMQAGVKVKAKPEEQIADAGARKFFALGLQALSANDAKGAVMNLRMALGLEQSPIIKEALARAEASFKGK